MANTLKRSIKKDVSTVQQIYTCPAATTAVVIALQIANVDASATVTVDVYLDDQTDKVHLVKNHPILVGAASQVIDGKVVLQTSDDIDVIATGGNVDVIMTYLEQT